MTNRENPIHRIKSYLGSGSGSKSKWYGSETLQTRELSYDFEMLMSTRKPVIRKMCLLLEFRICLFQFWLRTVYIQTKYRRPFSLLNLHIPVLRIRIFWIRNILASWIRIWIRKNMRVHGFGSKDKISTKNCKKIFCSQILNLSR